MNEAAGDHDFSMAQFKVDRNGRVAREIIAKAVPRIILANKANEVCFKKVDFLILKTFYSVCICLRMNV